MTTQRDGTAEEQTETTEKENEPFSGLRKMGEPGQEAAGKLKEACGLLRTKGMNQEADRLERLDDFADKVDFATLDRLVAPERTIEEFAVRRNRRVQRLHALRNVLAVTPLLVTWVALAFASIDYSKELAKYPRRVTKPFLLLWQQGFGRHFLTFSFFGKLDLALLALVLIFTVWVHVEEDWLLNQQTGIDELIDGAMGDLAIAISSGLGRAPENAKELAESAERMLRQAVDKTNELTAKGLEAIERASADLKKAYTEEHEYVERLTVTTKDAFAALSKGYEQVMSNTAEVVKEAIGQQMTPLLDKLGGLVEDFAKHHETYRSGVDKLTSGVDTLSLSAKALATSADDHAKVGVDIGANLAKVAESQRDFADQVTLNVESMKTSADAMKSTAEVLRVDVLSGLKDLSDNVNAASLHLQSVESSLATTTSALGSSSQALQTSSDSLTKVTQDMRMAASELRRSIGNSIRERIFGRRRANT